jgi:hypothetical protein
VLNFCVEDGGIQRFAISAVLSINIKYINKYIDIKY